MKISFAAFAGLLLAGSLPQPVYAQAPSPGQPYIQVPVPGIPGFGQQQPRGERDSDRDSREHCERLRDREQDLRDRLADAPRYGEERERLEYRLREVRDERERCRNP